MARNLPLLRRWESRHLPPRVSMVAGQVDEAREMLGRAEALLRRSPNHLELGKLLCVRALVENLAGDPASARAARAETEALAHQIGAGPRSELGILLAAAAGMLPRA